jgi:hypothetical protein
MLTNDDFISLRDDLETISMDDEDFAESNIEDMESDPEAETSMTIDYWFGKMYLRSQSSSCVTQSMENPWRLLM